MTQRSRDRSSEGGFTLLELLVTMLVLAILSGIAVPVFYHQRRKGWIAHVHSALKHMANAENNYLYGEGGDYTLSVEELVANGYRFNEKYVEPMVLAADAGTFCIQMTSTKDPSIVMHFSSQVGRIQEGPGTDSSCGLPPGTLVAGEFDPDAATPGATTTARDSDNDGIPDHEDPDTSNPGGDSDPPNPGGDSDPPNPGGDPDPPNPGGDSDPPNPGGDSDPSNPGGDSDPSNPGGDSKQTGKDPSGGGSKGGKNGGDGGCRGDRNDPDGDDNGGRDEIGGSGGDDPDRDCNNGSGNDDDGDDDNNAGGKGK